MAVPTLGGAQLWADRRWRAGWRAQQNILTGHARVLDPSDRRHASGALDACLETLDRLAPPLAADHLVVLLHGLGRSRRSMRLMGASLREAGLGVAALDYPSTRRPIEDHVAQVREVITDILERGGPERLSFVTHSLGGIVARGVLDDDAIRARTHRLVMCAPPSSGAALARLLHERAAPLFHAIMGPVGAQLGVGQMSVPLPRVPFMVIAGRGKRGELNPLLEGDDDGIVTVEETRLDGMADHLVVESLHTFVMDHPEARAATVRFLTEG